MNPPDNQFNEELVCLLKVLESDIMDENQPGLQDAADEYMQAEDAMENLLMMQPVDMEVTQGCALQGTRAIQPVQVFAEENEPDESDIMKPVHTEDTEDTVLHETDDFQHPETQEKSTICEEINHQSVPKLRKSLTDWYNEVETIVNNIDKPKEPDSKDKLEQYPTLFKNTFKTKTEVYDISGLVAL